MHTRAHTHTHTCTCKQNFSVPTHTVHANTGTHHRYIHTCSINMDVRTVLTHIEICTHTKALHNTYIHLHTLLVYAYICKDIFTDTDNPHAQVWIHIQCCILCSYTQCGINTPPHCITLHPHYSTHIFIFIKTGLMSMFSVDLT